MGCGAGASEELLSPLDPFVFDPHIRDILFTFTLPSPSLLPTASTCAQLSFGLTLFTSAAGCWSAVPFTHIRLLALGPYHQSIRPSYIQQRESVPKLYTGALLPAFGD